jgi:hypothetical protein
MAIATYTINELEELEQTPCGVCRASGEIVVQRSTGGFWRFSCNQCHGWGAVWRRRDLAGPASERASSPPAPIDHEDGGRRGD